MLKHLFLIIFISIFCFEADAGWHLVYQQKSNTNEQVIQIFTQSTWIKISSLEKDVIFESRDKLLTIISHKNQCVWSGKVSEFFDIQAIALKAAYDIFSSTLDSTQENYLKSWMLPLKGPKNPDLFETPKIRTISTKKADKFLKFQAEKMEVYAHDKLVENLWISNNKTIFKEIDLKTFHQLLLLLEIPESSGYELSDDYFALLNKGLMCKREQFLKVNNNKIVLSYELTAALEDEFPADLFLRPFDYTEINLFDLLNFIYSNQLTNKLEL